MADINTDSSKEKFIFGQNMEDRVIKSPESTDASNEGEGEGGRVSSQCSSPRYDDEGVDGDRPLLRPSAFTPSHNVLAPGRLGNPFVAPATGMGCDTRTNGQHTVVNEGVVGSAAISNNPFAAHVSQPSYSDSDDEKKEKPIVAPSHFTPAGGFGAGGFGFGSNTTPTSSRLLLKPSTLDKQTANFNKENSRTGNSNFRTSFKLEPAKLKNPFLKTDSDNEDGPENQQENEATEQAIPQKSSACPEDVQERLQAPPVEELKPSDSTQAKNTCEVPPVSGASFLFGQNMQSRIFGQLSSSSEAKDEPGGFVFGQSLQDRVVSPKSNGTAQTSTEDGTTAELPVESPDSDKTKSLMESAAAHQARLAIPEFEEVEVKTGEEDESNVFQIYVKLFLFNKENQTWLEKGRGQLRLNDMSSSNGQSFQSRLVMRTQGSLRVVMNTKVWPAMLVEMASEKSIRITAMEQDGSIKIYLIMASRCDVSHIYSAINSRVQQLRAHSLTEKEEPQEATSSDNTQDMSQTQSQPPIESQPEKRKSAASSPDHQLSKRPKITRHNIKSEESNDSSTLDPETEASNESCASSPTVKSTSSD